jgi:hypothetical protein
VVRYDIAIVELGAFGRAVRQLRDQQAMSAGELARAAGLDRWCIEGSRRAGWTSVTGWCAR